MNLRDEDLVTHILDAITAIQAYVADGEKFFVADRKTQDAVIRNLEVIGEAVSKLSAGLKSGNPDVPWARISGMRNRLIHGYLTVDLGIVWQTVERVLPDFKSRIEKIAGKSGGSS
ncbi:MAG: HepT-like ribonuclease domain-containing protein [Burkholderiales bacterium]